MQVEDGGAERGKENVHGQVCGEASEGAAAKADVGDRGRGEEGDGGGSSTEGLRLVSSTVASLQATMGGAMQKMAATLKQSCERPWRSSGHSHSRRNSNDKSPRAARLCFQEGRGSSTLWHPANKGGATRTHTHKNMHMHRHARTHARTHLHAHLHRGLMRVHICV
jgi:hypothetical protein